jgi:hypothetical protein
MEGLAVSPERAERTRAAPDRSRVAPADATWLMMDEPINPMMITGILWFGEPVDQVRLLDTLQRRLVDRYPKFASRIVHHAGVPYWEPDPDFDLLAHVHRAALPAPAQLFDRLTSKKESRILMVRCAAAASASARVCAAILSMLGASGASCSASRRSSCSSSRPASWIV